MKNMIVYVSKDTPIINEKKKGKEREKKKKEISLLIHSSGEN